MDELPAPGHGFASSGTGSCPVRPRRLDGHRHQCPRTDGALRQVLGLPGEAQVLDRVTQMAETGDDVRDRLRVDVRSVRPNDPGRAGLARDLGWVGDHDRLIDEFGIGWQMPRHGGHYYDLYFSPLADCRTVADIERYPWPDALDPARFEGLEHRVNQVVEQERARRGRRADACGHVGACHVDAGV